MTRKLYPSDVSDDEWAFIAPYPYLTVMTEDAPQREYALREVFNGLRWIIRLVPHGACCPTTCRPGIPSINKPNAG